MAVAVSLRRVIEELDALMDDFTSYLNRETGEVCALADDEVGRVEDGVDLENLPEWQQDSVPLIREVLDSGDWLALPSRFDVHEWAIMDGFASSVDDSALSEELQRAIRGTGAFRSFKDAAYRHEIQDSWYRYRAVALGRIAADWLEEHGIPYVHDGDAEPAGQA